MIHAAAVPRRSERVVCRSLVDGEAVLLHLDSGQYHGLNETGVAVWELIDGERSAAAITREVRGGFEDAPADVDRLVRGFLSALDERDLVVVRPGS